MSLRIWLPLNGNLNNQGLDPWTPNIKSDTSETYVDGKIGKALNTGGVIMPSAVTNRVLNNKAVSYCCWIYVNGTTGSTTERQMIFGNSSMVTNNNRKFSLFQYPTCNDLHFSFMNDTASTTFVSGTLTGVLPSSKWTHIAMTYDNPTVKIYINGELKHTVTGVSNSSTFAYDTNMIWDSSYHYLNDVRLYDHCLSAKEVKEISKGLILHYKLSGIGGENLVTDSQHLSNVFSMAGTSTWTRSYVTEGTQQIWKATCTAGGTNGVHTPLFPKTADKIGKKYTYSVKVKANKNVSVNIGSECGGLKAQDVTTSWKTFTYTWTFTDGTYQSFVWYTSSANWAAGDWIMVKDLKIEEGDKATPWCPHTSDALYTSMGLNNNIEYDLSGYKNNGTKANSFKYVSDSVRYTGSYDMSSALSNINLPDIKYETMKQGTIAFWLKVPNSFNYWTHYLFLANSFNWTGKESDFILVANQSQLSSATTSTAINLDCCSYGSGFTAKVNTWYFITITWNKDTYTICKYVDGAIIATHDDSSAKRLDTYPSKHNAHGIGNINQSNNYQGNKLLNDFRIYATALSADDIKELYQTAALIDNKGNAYAYEFVEA